MRIFTIFRKDLKDVLRDRRTILMMVVMPLLLVPGMISIVTKVQMNQVKKAEDKQLKIKFVGKEYTPDLYDTFVTADKIILLDMVPEDSINAYIQQEYLDAAIIVTPDDSAGPKQVKRPRVKVVYKGSESLGITKDRIQSLVNKQEQEIVQVRLKEMGLDRNIVKAYKVNYQDITSKQEMIGKIAGGYLPYLFIIFGFMGAMYPGLDLGAGEKERGTLETLLSSPASRLDIVFGKFLVVLLAAVLTAFLAMAGLFYAVQSIPDIPQEFLTAIKTLLNGKMVLMIMSLVLPISAFFSAMILSLSIYARSFKEAQSIVAPLNIVIIFPALIGAMPGVELNSVTALIPVLNVSLAAKDVVAGTVDFFYMLEVYFSLFLLAGLSIWFCVKWFNREETIFRS
ncbi:MAG: ABC transporter permease subunit [Fidelibacterota bacterium]